MEPELHEIAATLDTARADIRELQAKLDELASPAAPDAVLYSSAIEPIFRQHCFTCHSPDKKRGGLDMTSLAAMLGGGDTGPALVPGDPKGSLLVQLVRHEAEPFMPHKEPKLPDAAIAQIESWIEAGAVYPAHAETATKSAHLELQVTDKDRTFWSFQPLSDPQPPAVRDLSWVQTPIDHFILAKQEAAGIAPNPTADRRTLIRRAYFDLLGLPPTPHEVETFVHDASPNAYERLIDRLLASPHYGERWGRHWLDVARYADSDGYEFDVERPTAYHYRDFVIKALNADMPFDQFVKWQIAGDEFEPDSPLAIAATGFCTNGPIIDNQVLEKNRYDELDDIVSTTASAFLGMTLACARCHDHKFEPIPQRDYYRMVAIFNSTKRSNAVLASRHVAREFLEREGEWQKRLNDARKARDEFVNPLRAARVRTRIEALEIPDADKLVLLADINPNDMIQVMLRKKFEKELTVSDDEIRSTLDEQQLATWAQLEKDIAAIEPQRPIGPPRALALTDQKAEPLESWFLERGEVERKRETVTMGFLSVLPGDPAEFSPARYRPESATTTFQRTALAEWLTDVDRGAGRLTARVIVNRLWHYHFGRGIVGTPSDFGFQGDRPTHPELLDFLARELIRNGWKLKPLHKLIMMSSVYRQTTEYDAPVSNRDGAVFAANSQLRSRHEIDPENRLWWRRVPVRLESEIIRDAMLSVSGCLNENMFGPAVLPYVHEDAIATHTNPLWPVGIVDGPDTWRRSIYAQVRRSARIPMMEVFDAPDTVISCARRMSTTVPSQALELLNGKFANDQAGHFARRVQQECGENSPEAFIQWAYRLALGRDPAENERDAGKRFLLEQAARHMLARKPVLQAQHDARVDFCHVVLNLNEFVYVN